MSYMKQVAERMPDPFMDAPCPTCKGLGVVERWDDGYQMDVEGECPDCAEPLKVNGVWREPRF